MRYGTLAEYQREIDRVQAAIDKTSSEHLRMDYGKYLKRLQREAKRFMKGARYNG